MTVVQYVFHKVEEGRGRRQSKDHVILVTTHETLPESIYLDTENTQSFRCMELNVESREFPTTVPKTKGIVNPSSPTSSRFFYTLPYNWPFQLTNEVCSSCILFLFNLSSSSKYVIGTRRCVCCPSVSLGEGSSRCV